METTALLFLLLDAAVSAAPRPTPRPLLTPEPESDERRCQPANGARV